MFGKKKDKGAAKAEKPAKAKKSKKSKAPKSTEGQSRFAEGGVKSLVTQNIEKAALAAIALVAAYVAFTSWQAPGLPSDKESDELVTLITRAEANIEKSTWAERKNQEPLVRQAEAGNYQKRATADVAPVNPADYPLAQPLEPLRNGEPKKRTDAELLALRDLEVTIGFGALASVEIQRQTSRTPQIGDDGESTSMMEDDPDLRELPEEVATRLSQRMRALSLPPEAKMEARQFVCITGLLPLKEQVEKYMEAYGDATGFNQERDLPRYTQHFQVERARIEANGKLGPWRLIWGGDDTASKRRDKRTKSEIGKFFRVRIDDTVRQDALVPGVTLPIPSLVNRDLTVFKHSKIKTQLEIDEERNKQDMETSSAGVEVDPFAAGGGMGGGGMDGGGYGGGGYGGGGYGGAGGVGPPGGGGGYGAAPGAGYSGAGGGYGAAPGAGYSGAGGGYGGSMDGGGGGYGGGGYGGGMGGGGGSGVYFNDLSGEAVVTIDAKMFRFFDFKVQPGTKYRYRVRLSLEDPNNPQNYLLAPRQKHMEPKVIARVMAIPKVKKAEDRIHWRHADWSAPSPIAALARPEVQGAGILAGTVKLQKAAKAVVNSKPVFYRKASNEPEINVVVVAFDNEYNGDIPGHSALRRGSVANFKKSNVELVDLKAGQGMLRKKKDHKFRSDMMVLDIMGGDELPARKGEDKLYAPGEMLVFNSSGQLEVHRELEEAADVSYYTFPKAEASEYGGAAGGGYGGGGYGGGRNNGGY